MYSRPQSLALTKLLFIASSIQPSRSVKAAVLKAVCCNRFGHLVGLVADKSNDHAVEVEEEHQEVETQLNERFLAIVSRVHLG